MTLDGERARLRDQIKTVHALLGGLESSLDAGVPCAYNAEAVAHSTAAIVAIAARHDVYLRELHSHAKASR